MNLLVQQSPSTKLAFYDVVVFNSKYFWTAEGNYALVKVNSEKQLMLPIAFNKGVVDHHVGLSIRQRKYLQIDLGDSVNVSLHYESVTPFPLVDEIGLFVSCYFFGGEPRDYRDKVPAILQRFNYLFSEHVFNRGHIIPLKVSGMLFEVEVKYLSDGVSEWNYVMMSRDCKIFVDHDEPMEEVQHS